MYPYLSFLLARSLNHLWISIKTRGNECGKVGVERESNLN